MSQENITTLHMLEQAGEIGDNDLLYVVQGSGSDRDRKASVKQLLGAAAANNGKVKTSESDLEAGFLVSKFPKSTDYSEEVGDLTFSEVAFSRGKVLKAKIKTSSVTAEKLDTDSVLTNKIKNGAVTYEKLSDDLKPNVLPFFNASVANLNGTDLIVNNVTKTDYSYLGEIGNPGINRLVDFTFCANFWLNGQYETIPYRRFYLIVWRNRAPITEDKIIEKRLVSLSSNTNLKIVERFVFKMDNNDNVKISLIGESLDEGSNSFIFGNVQLKGFAL